MDDELRDSIRGHAMTMIATGFKDRDEVRDSARDLFAEDATESEIDAIVDAAIDDHEASKAGWPEVTDCDRLDAAFDELNARGIMARHDWWCCSTCGHGAMSDEYERVCANEPVTTVRGYAFYNNQTTEGAADGAPLFLAYGAVEEGEAAALAIAREVVETLTRHRLAVEWPGTVDHTIVARLVWQRRRRPDRWTES